MTEPITIRRLRGHVGETVTLRGWVVGKRSSGKIHFVQFRDGSGVVQAVASRADVSEAAWAELERATQESTVTLTGTVREDKRSPSGVEIGLSDFRVDHLTLDFPITPKEHGTAFLMENRHLWMRSSRQRAALRIRSEVEQGIHDFFHSRDYVRIDSPILTPAACEGTSTLFSTDYFGEKAFLSQSGQLYAEAGALALGKVYTFGPTFRAEKSKTRRHLLEFWMVEPEVAYLEHDDNMLLQEELLAYLDHCRRKADAVLGALTDEEAERPARIGQPYGEVLIRNLIQLTDHAAHLNLFLNRGAQWSDPRWTPADRWYRRCPDCA